MRKVLAVAAMVTLMTAGCTSAGVPRSNVKPALGHAWKRVWIDEFSGHAGLPAGARWRSLQGGDGWGNSELEYYTTGTNNAELDGRGNLAITARKATVPQSCWYGNCEYTSARLTTDGQETVRYGRIEARMRLPAGTGLWSAFWMLGSSTAADNWPNDGEIDVMENLGSDPRRIYGSLHGPGYSGATSLTSTYSILEGEDFSHKFHTFSVVWTQSSIQFRVDGRVFETQTPNTTRGNEWVFTHPFSIILNLAVGGTWPGKPTSHTVFPATLLVDYVALYTR